MSSTLDHPTAISAGATKVISGATGGAGISALLVAHADEIHTLAALIGIFGVFAGLVITLIFHVRADARDQERLDLERQQQTDIFHPDKTHD